MGELGNKFRKARESKNLSLDDVSNVIKISARMLKAIEEEKFDQLPGGVFNRGFIRAYAKHVGLNEEEAVSDYLASLRQQQAGGHEVLNSLPPSREPASSKHRRVEASKGTTAAAGVDVEELPDLQLPRAEDVRPSRRRELGQPSEFPWGLMAVVLVLVVLGVVFWIRHSRGKRAGFPATAPTTAKMSPASSMPGTSTVPERQPAMPVPAPPVHSAAHNANSPTVHSQSLAGAAGPGTITPAAELAHTKVPTAPSPSSSDAPVAKPLMLVIRATETSWVSISADGQAVAQETLIAPAHTTVRANREIAVRVGNAAGVSFTFNGKELPTQGAESEAKSFVFDAQGMKAPTSAQAPAP